MRIQEIITESSRSAPLYHSTPAPNLLGILSQGQIQPGPQGWTSLTRDPRYAYRSWEDDPAVQLVIDQAALAQRRHIEPYDWHMASDETDEPEMRDPGERRSESEERVRGSVPTSLVRSIWLPRGWQRRMPRDVKKALALAQQQGIGIEFRL